MIRNIRLAAALRTAAITAIAAGGLARPAVAAHVYTINNDVNANGVIGLVQNADGTLKEMPGSPFATGGKGLSGGDIDQQGAIRVFNGYVLAVNAGSDSVAVLQMNGDGSLTPVKGSPFASGGCNPISLTAHGDKVYVANQSAPWTMPKVAPNITGFRMDKTGALTRIADSTITFKEGAGPAQIEFSPTGETIVVTAGFQDASTSAVHSYQIMNDGSLMEAMGSPARTKGPSGVVGFSWNEDGNRVYVSDFRGSAVSIFEVNPETAAIKLVGKPHGTEQGAACWTACAPDGKSLYVVNFVSNSVTSFDMNKDGSLKLIATAPRRGESAPDLKDVIATPDGKFVYALGSGARQISIFKVNADRGLTELPQGMSPSQFNGGQNYLGLAVYCSQH